jgi:hypothetical protein
MPVVEPNTSVDSPARAQNNAAVNPAGPAPTTTTSQTIQSSGIGSVCTIAVRLDDLNDEKNDEEEADDDEKRDLDFNDDVVVVVLVAFPSIFRRRIGYGFESMVITAIVDTIKMAETVTTAIVFRRRFL